MFNSAPLALKNKAEFLEISFFAILEIALRLSALAKGWGVSWARLVGLRAICIHYFDEKLLQVLLRGLRHFMENSRFIGAHAERVEGYLKPC